MSAEEPLTARLTERTAEIEKLRQESAQLKADVSRLQSQLTASRSATGPIAAAAARPAAAPSPSNTPASSTTDTSRSPTVPSADASPPVPIRETVFLRQPDKPVQTSWAFLLGIATVMLLVGFFLGWTTLDRRIRQKYGGLRIY